MYGVEFTETSDLKTKNKRAIGCFLQITDCIILLRPIIEKTSRKIEKEFWDINTFVYLCNPKKSHRQNLYLSPDKVFIIIRDIIYRQKNIKDHEKDLSTLEKTQKKQAWVPQKNGIYQWAQSIGFQKSKRKKKTECIL